MTDMEQQLKKIWSGADAADIYGEQSERLEKILWDELALRQNRPFYTSKNLEFTYTIRGNEMFVDRKEKSITRATVNKAFYRALELRGVVTGPKKLGTFGASYLYPVFIELGIARKTPT